MRNSKSSRVFSDKLSIRVLDLTKTELAIPGRDDELKKWAAMFKADSFGELRQLAAAMGKDEAELRAYLRDIETAKLED